MNARLVASMGFFVVGIGFSIWQGYEKDSICTGIALGLSVLYLFVLIAIGISMATHPACILLASVIGALGIYCAISESRAVDINLIEARATVAERLSRIHEYCPQKINVDLYQLSQVGPPVCVTQHAYDQLELLNDLVKAQHLDVGTSMIDSIIQSAGKKNNDVCAEIFMEVEAICPAAFSRMPSAEQKALMRASGVR